MYISSYRVLVIHTIYWTLMSIVLGHVVDLDTIETEAQRIPES